MAARPKTRQAFESKSLPTYRFEDSLPAAEVEPQYLYEIGYGTYEESWFRQYWHRDLITEKRLNTVVEECLIEVLLEIQEPRIESLYHSPVFEAKLRARGFRAAEFTAKNCFWGWADLDVPGSWSRRGDPLYRMQTRVRKRIQNTRTGAGLRKARAMLREVRAKKGKQ